MTSETANPPFGVQSIAVDRHDGRTDEHATGLSGVADAEVARLAARAIAILSSEKGASAPQRMRRGWNC
jgi:hypothetical protein